MKTTISTLRVAAIFAVAAFSLTTGFASAQSSVAPPVGGDGDHVITISPRAVNPARGGYDGSGPIFNKEWQARTTEAWQLGHDAAADLHFGNYAQAEVEAREALAISDDGVAEEVLAAALDAQGKDKEALQQYQTVVDHYDRSAHNLLTYALLLLKSGQWAQAVTAYNHTLLDTDKNELCEQLPLFSPEVPEPLALETALHLERGRIYNDGRDWAGNTQNTQAMEEYNKALQLAPDSALTNYYYGMGWQRLTPAERTKFGTAQQAKAHLQKAIKIGNASVRAAAAKALKSAG